MMRVLLRFTDSDYPFDIFKFFLLKQMSNLKMILVDYLSIILDTSNVNTLKPITI